MSEAVPPSSSGGEATLTSAEHYRKMAWRCFRLARSITDRAVIETLENLGHDYERKARQLCSRG